MSNPILDQLPVIPPWGTGLLMFLQSGDFLWQYRRPGKPGEGKKTVEGAHFVTIRDVQNAFGEVRSDTGWLAPGIMRVGYCEQGDWFIYRAQPQVRSILVDMPNGKTRKLVVPLPHTILFGVGNLYYIYACRDVLGPRSFLLRLPFPNVYGDGKICWGKNSPPKAHHRHAKDVWELFFNSTFNGDLSNEKSKKYPRDARSLLAHLSRKKVTTYPVEDLIEHSNITPQALVRSVNGKDEED